uniref:Flagellar export chaperone FliS n=1 Tax=Caldimicrobium thiodismutans TaxID=1653476 RepID=A0A832LUB2_9BACT
MLNPQHHYMEREVLQASPLDQIILLYNRAINSLKMVERSISENKPTPESIKSRAENLSRVIDILTYLTAILDEEKGKEIAKNLKEIYTILIEELIKVNFTMDKKVVNDAIDILENLKRAWIDIRCSFLGKRLDQPRGL